jgi:hypothetical protein
MALHPVFLSDGAYGRRVRIRVSIESMEEGSRYIQECSSVAERETFH